MSLKRALLVLIVSVLVLGTIPAGLMAYGRLVRALENQVRESLSMAPELLASRWEGTVDVRMMHARDVARTPGLAEALAEGRDSDAVWMVERAGAGFPEVPILVGPQGRPLLGDGTVPSPLLDATRRGNMPVETVSEEGRIRILSLAPVTMGTEWMGAAGGTSILDDSEAATLAGLTRSEVLILDQRGTVTASSTQPEEAGRLASGVLEATSGTPTGIRDVDIDGVPYLSLFADLGNDARVVFLKNLEREMAVLPLLRGIALWSAGITLVLTLLLGSLFATRIARPVGSLADAAGRLAAGDFDAPLEPSGVREVRKVSEAFDQMRNALRNRLADLEEANARLAHANQELEDRQQRLVVLQGELVQRDRLASAGRLLSQLAHEIRNPIASIRNCLEVLRRRTGEDQEARDIADMAIDELLRMHELTEQMMDVHRPRDPDSSSCDLTQVAREVANLLKAGTQPNKELNISIVSPGIVHGRVAPDALKQVLLTLGSNAREAMDDEGPMEMVIREESNGVSIDVLDRGPGIPGEILPRIFDPFFTTKAQLQGVGLGLFTAEAVVRTYGGTIEAANRVDGPGARFTVELPAAESQAGTDGNETEEDGAENA